MAEDTSTATVDVVARRKEQKAVLRPLASIDEGEIVKSKVLEIRDNMVVLDIGFKSEGSIPLEEFKDMPDLKPGDEVEVLLEHLEDQEGSVVLSKKKADFMRVWEKIRIGRASCRERV